VNPALPFPNPIMLGCAFAIDRSFFLDELGGYDREFRIWNGENYELSLKLWLCADGFYEVPCSRVAHTFRFINPSRQFKEDYVARNFKRLVEVWFDEYKQVVYQHDEERYKKVDAGDLTAPLAVKGRLNCKPFSYFLEEIAPDIPERYPFDTNLPIFASGQIRSLSRQDICIDTMFKSEFESIGLYYCSAAERESDIPQSQFFRLTFLKNIVFGYMEYCLDSFELSMPQCHYTSTGNQYWRYDHVKNMLINSYDDGPFCLAAKFEDQALEMKACDESDVMQKWRFTYENKTALEEWKDIYGYTKFVYGEKKLRKDKMLPLKSDECNFI
jgi:polypeptide N-acetylgalactosaminyltransferase